MRNIYLLFLMEFFAGFSRGSYLVCIGWTTLIVTGDVAAVGQVFVVAMLTIMIAGPFVGTIVDRHNKKDLTIIAHLGIATSMAIIGVALSAEEALSKTWFFAAVILVSIFRLLYQSCHDGLIQANIPKEKLLHSVARFRTTHLLATAIGTALTGIIISSFSPASGFVFSALTSVLLIIVATFVRGITSKENAPGFFGFLDDLKIGMALFRSNASLRTLTIITAIALPVGQLSNAVLSSFMRDDLGLGPAQFGFVDAAWPLGGMFAAAVLSFGLKKLSAPYMEYALGLVIGGTTIVFSLMSSVISLAIVHAALGFSVWMCGIIIDGRLLQTSSKENVGRSKAFIQVSYGFAAMVMSLSPTFIKLPSSSTYFFYWGIIIVVLAGALTVIKLTKARAK